MLNVILRIICFFSIMTEVWDFENGTNTFIQPSLTNYYDGVALFAVDADFCAKANKLI